MPLSATDFKRVPIERATKPPETSGRHWVTVNSWWAVTADDCLLIYQGSRQCNADKRCVERVIELEGHPGVKVVHLPLVFI